MNTSDLWLSLHREIGHVLAMHAGPRRDTLYVYKLFPFSIDIVVGSTGAYVHVNRKDIRPNGGSTIVITSNKHQGELTASADPENGFVLTSGQALSVDEFCLWLFDLALRISEPEGRKE
jgi:hypothetical protein